VSTFDESDTFITYLAIILLLHHATTPLSLSLLLFYVKLLEIWPSNLSFPFSYILTGWWSICPKDSSYMCCKTLWYQCWVSWGQRFLGIFEGFDIWQ